MDIEDIATDDYEVEEYHELWKELFGDLHQTVKQYLKKAIEMKYGDIRFQCEIYPSELESAIDGIMTDFISSVGDNLGEVEIAVQNYFDSLADVEFTEEEEKWNRGDEDEINLGLDKI